MFDHTSAEPAICCCSCRGEPRAAFDNSVRDLGILIDSDVAMLSHVLCTVSGCFATLGQLRSIRRSVSDSAFHSLVVSLVMPRSDYGNATFAGLPESQLRRLRLVHVTPMLQDLHWLRSPERIDFKLAVLVYRCLHGLWRHGIFPTTSSASPIPTTAVFSRRHPHS